jgi:hypothetical protein
VRAIRSSPVGGAPTLGQIFALLRTIHPLQSCGGQQERERAAHGEPLSRAVRRAFARCRVDHGNAEATAVDLLEPRESRGGA